MWVAHNDFPAGAATYRNLTSYDRWTNIESHRSTKSACTHSLVRIVQSHSATTSKSDIIASVQLVLSLMLDGKYFPNKSMPYLHFLSTLYLCSSQIKLTVGFGSSLYFLIVTSVGQQPPLASSLGLRRIFALGVLRTMSG